MGKETNHIANRVLLGGAIGFASLIILLLLGALVASIMPEHKVFFTLKLIIGLVFAAVLIGDRVYVARNKS